MSYEMGKFRGDTDFTKPLCDVRAKTAADAEEAKQSHTRGHDHSSTFLVDFRAVSVVRSALQSVLGSSATAASFCTPLDRSRAVAKSVSLQSRLAGVQRLGDVGGDLRLQAEDHRGQGPRGGRDRHQVTEDTATPPFARKSKRRKTNEKMRKKLKTFFTRKRKSRLGWHQRAVTGAVLSEICTVPDSLFRVCETIF